MSEDKKNKQYVGSGWRINFRNNNSFIINIDIIEKLLPSPDINGKIHLTVSARKKIGKYNETHTVYVNEYKGLEKTVNVKRSNIS